MIIIKRREGKYVVIISLMTFLFKVIVILIPVCGKLECTSSDLVIVKSVISSGCVTMRCWVRRYTVSLAILLTSILMEHSWGGNGILSYKSVSFYLSVKRILLQLVDTLELMSVTLHHGKAVFCPFEDLNLIKHLISTSLKFPLSFDQNICDPLPIFTQSCCLQLVSVGVDNQR